MSTRNVKLCLASPVLYPPRGGAEKRFFGYLSGLQRRGIDIRIFSGTPKAKKLTEEDFSQDWYQASPGRTLPNAAIDGVPIHRVRLLDKSGWRRVMMFNKALLDFCCVHDYRPDVIQLLEPLSPLATPWLYRIKKLGIARAFAYTLAYEMPAGHIRRSYRLLALKLLYGQLDYVITGSTITQDIARGLGLNNPIEVIANGVDLQRFHPVPQDRKRELRTALGLDIHAKLITTVGSVIPRKGIDLLLEAWILLAARCPDLHLLVVGPRNDQTDPKLKDFHNNLRQLANKSGASDRIHFAGRVKNVDSYLQASDLFVFTSEREGMANAVLEAMATDLPVVMTPHIGLPPDFGEPSRHYLLAERSPSSICSKIMELLNDVERFKELASNGRRLVQDTMDLEIILDRYANLYFELATHRKGFEKS